MPTAFPIRRPTPISGSYPPRCVLPPAASRNLTPSVAVSQHHLAASLVALSLASLAVPVAASVAALVLDTDPGIENAGARLARWDLYLRITRPPSKVK